MRKAIIVILIVLMCTPVFAGVEKWTKNGVAGTKSACYTIPAKDIILGSDDGLTEPENVSFDIFFTEVYSSSDRVFGIDFYEGGIKKTPRTMLLYVGESVADVTDNITSGYCFLLRNGRLYGEQVHDLYREFNIYDCVYWIIAWVDEGTRMYMTALDNTNVSRYL